MAHRARSADRTRDASGSFTGWQVGRFLSIESIDESRDRRRSAVEIAAVSHLLRRQLVRR